MATATFNRTALPRVRPAGRNRVRDARVLVGTLLGLAVFAAGLGYWTLLAGPRSVVVVEREVPAGAPLTEADLGIGRVRVDAALGAQLYDAAELPTLVGPTTAEPLHAGELLMRQSLAKRSSPPPGMVLAAVPLKPESSPGPAAQPGSHVEVLATLGNAANADARSSVVLPNAEVIEVVFQSRSALLAGGEARASGPAEPAILRVLATPEEASALARAKATGTLEVVLLSPGGRPPDAEARP